jgi:hypothetical protein
MKLLNWPLPRVISGQTGPHSPGLSLLLLRTTVGQHDEFEFIANVRIPNPQIYKLFRPLTFDVSVMAANDRSIFTEHLHAGYILSTTATPSKDSFQL